MTDPNRDLVGKTLDAGHLGTLVVTGTTCWSPQYVKVESEDGKYQSVRNVEQMRIALRLQAQAA